MIRAAILDFNGVLVDDESAHCDLLLAILAEQGVVLSPSQYHEEYLGYDDRGCFETALGRAGRSFSPHDIAALIALKAERYRAWAQSQLVGFPGAAQVVRDLALLMPVAICSGAIRPEIEIGLEQLGVRSHVQLIVAAEDTNRCKPDPEGYLLALDGLRHACLPDLLPSQCLVVEDSLAGVQSALRAGMHVVAVAHTYTPLELQHAGAHHVVPSLASLSPEWVSQFLDQPAGALPEPPPPEPLADGAAPAVLVICTDLIFTAKIQGTAQALGIKTLLASRPEQVTRLLSERPFKLVLIDLAAGPVASPEHLAAYRNIAPQAQLLAFGSHVETDLLAQASAAGCDLVLPRSRFTTELAHLLRTSLPA